MYNIFDTSHWSKVESDEWRHICPHYLFQPFFYSWPYAGRRRELSAALNFPRNVVALLHVTPCCLYSMLLILCLCLLFKKLLLLLILQVEYELNTYISYIYNLINLCIKFTDYSHIYIELYTHTQTCIKISIWYIETGTISSAQEKKESIVGKLGPRVLIENWKCYGTNKSRIFFPSRTSWKERERERDLIQPFFLNFANLALNWNYL